MTINSRVPRGLTLALVFAASLARANEEPKLKPEPHERWDGERESFAGAVDRAMQRNPQVAIVMADIARARGLLEQVMAQSLPTATANGTYTRLDADRVLNGNVILGENQIGANLALGFPLIQARAWAAWAHASDNVKLARASGDEVRRQLASAAGRAYLTVLTQRKILAVSGTARDAARAHHDFAVARFKGGVGTRLDEVRAAQELATAEQQVAVARTQLGRAREALGVLLAAEGPIDAAEDPDLASHDTLTQAVQEANARADVRAATERRQAAHRVTRDSFADYLPLLSGVFQPFFQDPPSLTIPRTGWQAQLVLSIPIYDGGYRYGLRRERSALEQRAIAELEATLRQAKSEVRYAFGAVRDADEAMHAAQAAARLALEALKLANTAYREGASTNLELIDAERRARDAALLGALAEDSARQARLDLLVASGRFPTLK